MRRACLMLVALLSAAGCAPGGAPPGAGAQPGAAADTGRMAVAAFAEMCMNLDPAEIDRRARRFGFGEVRAPHRPASLAEGVRMYLRPSPAGPTLLFAGTSEPMCELGSPNLDARQVEAAFAEFVGVLSRSPQLAVRVASPEQVASAAPSAGGSRMRYAAMVMPAAVAPVPPSALILRANTEAQTPFHVMIHRATTPGADPNRTETSLPKDPVPAR